MVSEHSDTSRDDTLHTHTPCACEVMAVHPHGVSVMGTGGVHE